MEQNHSGKTVSSECNTFRIQALRHCYQANMSFGMLERFKGFVDHNSLSGLSIGCAKDLPRTIGPVLLIDEMERLRGIMKDCYPEFATISDGTPAGAVLSAARLFSD